MTAIRRVWPLALVAVGAIGLIATNVVAATTEWGPPGTDQYRTYEAHNRRVAVPVVVLIVGLLIVHLRQRVTHVRPYRYATLLGLVGAVLVLVGNVSEFWLFTDVPYGDQLRNLAWMAFVVGAVLLVSSLLVALAAHALARLGKL